MRKVLQLLVVVVVAEEGRVKDVEMLRGYSE
jgi:hypothetical protein